MRPHLLGAALAAAILGAALEARAAEPDPCARVCAQDDDARKDAQLVFLSSGRLIQGATTLSATSSVKVGVVEMNPFRWEYRVEVTATPRAAALALEAFGPRAGAAPPWPGTSPLAGILPRGDSGPPAGQVKSGEACTDAQMKEIAEAAVKARDALAASTPTAAAVVRAFLDDAAAFESAARAETLSAPACQRVCRLASSLRSRGDHGDLEKARALVDGQRKALTDAIADAQRVQKGASCRSVLDDAERRLGEQRDALDLDWKQVEEVLSKKQPRLARIQEIIAVGLDASSANQLFRDQALPAEPSTVTVRISRTDLWEAEPTEPVVTSADASVGRSRFTFSLGLGFTGLPERRAVRSPSAGADGAVVTVFAYDTESSFTPSIVGLLNASLLEGDCHKLGSCGLAVSAGVQPAGDPERLRYLAAGSFTSLDGALLLSAGAAVGQVEKLAGGFSPDQVVPDGLLEIPVRQEWDVGWFLALTYRVR